MNGTWIEIVKKLGSREFISFLNHAYIFLIQFFNHALSLSLYIIYWYWFKYHILWCDVLISLKERKLCLKISFEDKKF